MIADQPQKPSDPKERHAMAGFHTPEAIQHVIPNLQADARPDYVVEWGARVTDGALVLHFFPPFAGERIAENWPYDSRMDKKLEEAIPQVFDTSRITAGYEEDWKSFYVIAGGYASSLNVRMLVQKFLDAVDAA